MSDNDAEALQAMYDVSDPGPRSGPAGGEAPARPASGRPVQGELGDVLSEGVRLSAAGAARSRHGARKRSPVDIAIECGAMATALELSQDTPAPHSIQPAEIRRRLELTRRFAEWLCAWHPAMAAALPSCWDAHPILYRIMEAIRASYYRTLMVEGPGGEARWMLQVLYPLTDRLRGEITSQGLSAPHRHESDEYERRARRRRLERYAADGTPAALQPGFLDWAWPPPDGHSSGPAKG